MSAHVGSGSVAQSWTRWVGRRMRRIPTTPDDGRGTTGSTGSRSRRRCCCQAATVDISKLPVPPPPPLSPPHCRQPATAKLLPSLSLFCPAATTAAATPPPSCCRPLLLSHRCHHCVANALPLRHPLPLLLHCHCVIYHHRC
jgi:hypothetical protein